MKSLVLIALICLSGCASYNAAPLHTLSCEAIFSAPESQIEELIVVAKAFDKTDCKWYLDRNVLAEGFQPIQLYIENNSDKNYAFSLNRVSLSCVSPEVVAGKVHTSTVGRIAGYGAGALFFSPLLIPAIVDGIKSSRANKALDRDFRSKAANDQIILPHSSLNQILFVPLNKYQKNFKIVLIENESQTTKMIDVVSN